jgi:uncharacterized protein (TIGR03435 family)
VLQKATSRALRFKSYEGQMNPAAIMCYRPKTTQMELLFRNGVYGRMHKCLNSMLLVVVFAAAVCAQQQPQYEVATVKLSPPVPLGTPLPINLGSVNNGTGTLTNVTLSEWLQFAYGLVSETQVAGPDWIKSRDVRFDIVAKADPGVSRDDAKLMMQNLITERLKLSLHHEPREMPFLALVVAKSGPKLAPAKMDTPATQIPAQLPGRLLHPTMSMAILASLLSRFERQIVIDMTGLTGRFSVDLQWAPDALRNRVSQDGAAPSVNGQPVNLDGPSLPTALQEQLGLRLESRKGAVDVLVVDHAEKVPVDN